MRLGSGPVEGCRGRWSKLKWAESNQPVLPRGLDFNQDSREQFESCEQRTDLIGMML